MSGGVAPSPITILNRLGNVVPRLRTGLVLLIFLSLTAIAGLPFVYAQSGGVGPGETLQTNPKTRDNQVSATVPDNEPPTPPILISPSNGAMVTTSRPAFVWEGSSDEQGIAFYRLWLDGSVLYDNIPVTSTSNSNYVLTYNSVNNQYSLSPLSDIANGTHTWKVEVYDNTNNGNVSATWSFTIDTQAPSFVLTQIGTASVNISAQDVSTIPATPIELTANEPLLVGTGEANSTVQTTLIIPGEPSQFFTTPITSGGNFALQLGILPRGVVMTLNFLITDPAGNLSVLNGVQFYIRQDVIVIPPGSPSPTPSPLEPGASPEPSPPIGASPSPGVTPEPSPVIVIPLTPPREVIFRGTQRVIQALPEEIVQVVEELPEEIAPVSAAIVAGIIPIISTAAVATQFGGQLSLNLLVKILQALGLLPAGKPQGLVFDTKNGEGVPFAILTVTTAGQSLVNLTETVITNSEGTYQQIKLPKGDYVVSVSVQDYLFPTKLPRPTHLRISDFYKGEVISLREQESPTLLIPVDPLVDRARRPLNVRLRVSLARLSHYATMLLVPLFILSLLLAILFPSWWNWLVVGIYGLMLMGKLIHNLRQPLITGTIITDDGQPCANAIVRVRELENNQVAGISLTDKWGRFKFFGQPGTYEVSFQKQGYIWLEGNSPLSNQEVDARASSQQLVVTLTSLAKVYQSLGFNPV